MYNRSDNRVMRFFIKIISDFFYRRRIIFNNYSYFIFITFISVCYHIGSLSYISIGSYSLLFRLYHHLSVWDTRVGIIASFAHPLVVEPSSALERMRQAWLLVGVSAFQQFFPFKNHRLIEILCFNIFKTIS